MEGHRKKTELEKTLRNAYKEVEEQISIYKPMAEKYIALRRSDRFFVIDSHTNKTITDYHELDAVLAAHHKEQKNA